MENGAERDMVAMTETRSEIDVSSIRYGMREAGSPLRADSRRVYDRAQAVISQGIIAITPRARTPVTSLYRYVGVGEPCQLFMYRKTNDRSETRLARRRNYRDATVQ